MDKDIEWVEWIRDVVSRMNSPNKDGIDGLLDYYIITKDGEMRDLIDKMTAEIIITFLASEKPVLHTPEADDVRGVVLGTVLQGDKSLHQFTLSFGGLNMHVLIAASSGTGKTCLIRWIIAQLIGADIPAWIFDFKRDYRCLANHGDVWVFRWEQLRFNPFDPAPNVPAKVWRNHVLDCFAHNYGWFHSSRNHMQEFLGMLKQEKELPTLPELYALMKGYEERTRKRQEYGDVVLNRLYSCVENLGDVVRYRSSMDLEEMLNHTVVFELDGLARDEQNLLVTLLLYWVYCYRLYNNQRGRLRHALVFDEGKRVFDATKEYRQTTTELGVTPVDIITDEIREFGEAIIVADQEPTKLTHSIKANTYTKMCGFLGHGKDISDMAEAMNLEEDERKAISSLERGEWIVKLAGGFTKPFMIRSEDFPFESVDEEKLKERMEAVLFKLSKSEEAKEGEESYLPGLSAFAWALLVDVCAHPFRGIAGRREAMGMSGRKIESAKKELVRKNLLKEAPVILGSNRPTLFFMPTDLSLNLLKDGGHDVRLWKKIGNVGFEHMLYQVLISYGFRKAGWEAKIEGTIGRRRFDVLAVKDGKKVGVEVEYSTTDIKGKLKELDKIDELIVAVKDFTAIEKMKDEVSTSLPEVREKVRIVQINKFLSEINNKIAAGKKGTKAPRRNKADSTSDGKEGRSGD